MEVEKWKRHFRLMAEGKLRPNHKGHYIVNDVQYGSGSREPEIRFVTPLAQTVELAKSELKRDLQRGPLRNTKWKKGKLKRSPLLTKKRRLDYSIRPPGIPAYSKQREL